MKLKLDENISRHLKPILENLGHDVLTVSDQGLLSQDDITIGMAAKTEGRMLLILDLEFGDLRKYDSATYSMGRIAGKTCNLFAGSRV